MGLKSGRTRSSLRNVQVGGAIPDSGEHQWYMDEGSGTTLNDSVDGVSASVNGATWNTESGPVGGEYLSFVTDDYVLTDQSIDAAQTTFTVFGWARINTFSGFDHALTSAADPGNNTGAGWSIFTEGTSGEIGTVFAGSSFNRNIPFPSSGWGFFALIVDNQTYRLITFDNSSELADDTQSGSDRTPRTGDKLHLGRDARDQDYFDGDLDFCGFADKTLTKTEVTDLWDATKR